MTDLGKKKLTALAIFLGAAAVLLVASLVTPDPRGYGTHQQIHLPKIAGIELALPACSMKSLTGLPCATCGMTTSFAHAIRGQWGRAFVVQPFGFLLFVCTLGAAIHSAVYVTTNRLLIGPRVPWKKIGLILLLLWVVSWVYKIWMTLHQTAA